MRPARWRKEIAVGTAKTPRARGSSFSLSFAAFAPLRFKSSEPPKRAVPEAGANARMREYARPGGARKSRLEPPRRQERGGFLLSFASFAPLRFKSPEPPKRAVHEAGANIRMHECARHRRCAGERSASSPVYRKSGWLSRGRREYLASGLLGRRGTALGPSHACTLGKSGGGAQRFFRRKVDGTGFHAAASRVRRGAA